MAKINQETALDSSQFDWDAKTRTFSGEASTVGFNRCVLIYDDACDVGIYMRSHRTGKVVPFYLEKIDRDADNDVQAWHFKSTSLDNIKVTIFND